MKIDWVDVTVRVLVLIGLGIVAISMTSCLQPISALPTGARKEERKAAMYGVKGAPSQTAIPEPTAIEAESTGEGTICGTWNVRPEPAAAGGVVRRLGDGDSVTVYEWTNGWVKISPSTALRTEWVNGEALCEVVP